jgi:hypothetical protein
VFVFKLFNLANWLIAMPTFNMTGLGIVFLLVWIVSLMTFSLFIIFPSSLEAFWNLFLIFLLLDEMAKAIWFS